MPEQPVPAVETTYTCMSFEFPTDQEYHMVANQPYIDNIDVMHHILLYGCARMYVIIRMRWPMTHIDDMLIKCMVFQHCLAKELCVQISLYISYTKKIWSNLPSNDSKQFICYNNVLNESVSYKTEPY